MNDKILILILKLKCDNIVHYVISYRVFCLLKLCLLPASSEGWIAAISCMENIVYRKQNLELCFGKINIAILWDKKPKLRPTKIRQSYSFISSYEDKNIAYVVIRSKYAQFRSTRPINHMLLNEGKYRLKCESLLLLGTEVFEKI